MGGGGDRLTCKRKVSVDHCLLELTCVVIHSACGRQTASKGIGLIVVPGADIVVGVDFEHNSRGGWHLIDVTLEDRSGNRIELCAGQGHVAVIAACSLLGLKVCKFRLWVWQVCCSFEQANKIVRECRGDNMVVTGIYGSHICEAALIISLARACP